MEFLSACYINALTNINATAQEIIKYCSCALTELNNFLSANPNKEMGPKDRRQVVKNCAPK